MDSVAKKIEARISSWERGKVFFISDFADLGTAEVVRQTLNRLTKAGLIIRPGRGVYCYPKETSAALRLLGLGDYSEPSTDEIAEAIALRDKSRIVPHVAYAQYQLGLSQQIPMNVVYLTDGSGRKVPMGKGHGILFQHTSDMSIFAFNNKLMQLIVISMKGASDGELTEQEQVAIAEHLKKVSKKDFDNDIKLAPERVRVKLQKLYEVH